MVVSPCWTVICLRLFWLEWWLLCSPFPRSLWTNHPPAQETCSPSQPTGHFPRLPFPTFPQLDSAIQLLPLSRTLWWQQKMWLLSVQSRPVKTRLFDWKAGDTGLIMVKQMKYMTSVLQPLSACQMEPIHLKPLTRPSLTSPILAAGPIFSTSGGFDSDPRQGTLGGGHSESWLNAWRKWCYVKHLVDDLQKVKYLRIFGKNPRAISNIIYNNIYIYNLYIYNIYIYNI